MGWPSKNHRDYVEAAPEPEIETEPEPPARPRTVAESFTVSASRVNVGAIQESIERVATHWDCGIGFRWENTAACVVTLT